MTATAPLLAVALAVALAGCASAPPAPQKPALVSVDAWGGTPEKRRRMPVEIVRRTRAALGSDFIIDYREFLRWMSRGNSRSHANSWIGYCRLSRTKVTGYKKKRLGHPSEKLAGDGFRRCEVTPVEEARDEGELLLQVRLRPGSRHGSRMVVPVVLRLSRSRWACTASASA